MTEDYKETAPCGILIHYSVDSITGFLTYNDINGRGEGRSSEKCLLCSWCAVCKPTLKKVATLKELIEKFEIEENFIHRVLFDWVSHIEQPESYNKIYGFLCGLLSSSYITSLEFHSLIDDLFSLAFGH